MLGALYYLSQLAVMESKGARPELVALSISDNWSHSARLREHEILLPWLRGEFLKAKYFELA